MDIRLGFDQLPCSQNLFLKDSFELFPLNFQYTVWGKYFFTVFRIHTTYINKCIYTYVSTYIHTNTESPSYLNRHILQTAIKEEYFISSSTNQQFTLCTHYRDDWKFENWNTSLLYLTLELLMVLFHWKFGVGIVLYVFRHAGVDTVNRRFSTFCGFKLYWGKFFFTNVIYI